MKPRLRTTLVLILLTVCWCGSAVAGFLILEKYKATPGEQGVVRSQWPENTSVDFAPRVYNFVLALHPHCPCSRATVGELARILDRLHVKVCLHVLVYRPAGSAGDWDSSTLLDEVAALSGARLHVDIDAAEAERFGILTSGGLVLYGVHGELLFQGGITPSRGHAGDTAAQDAIRERLLGQASTLYTAPVFGCPLREPRS